MYANPFVHFSICFWEVHDSKDIIIILHLYEKEIFLLFKFSIFIFIFYFLKMYENRMKSESFIKLYICRYIHVAAIVIIQLYLF